MTKTHAVRLLPGADLKKSIEQYVQQQRIAAGWISCGIGSLTQYHIRFANCSEGTCRTGYFEIVCLAGTVSLQGLHLHISLSNSEGSTVGGHLLYDNLIYTTAEIIIQEATDLVFTRKEDDLTGWKELEISSR